MSPLCRRRFDIAARCRHSLLSLLQRFRFAFADAMPAAAYAITRATLLRFHAYAILAAFAYYYLRD